MLDLESESYRRAVQWWSHRQLCVMFEMAEMIRDGLLQDLFALRRQQELLLAQPSPDFDKETVQGGVRGLTQIYSQLQTLVEQLALLDVADNFGVSLQQVLERRLGDRIQLTVAVDLLRETTPISSQVLPLVFQFLVELVTLAVPQQSAPTFIHIQASSSHRLNVQLNYPNRAMSEHVQSLPELSNLRLAFAFLVSGQIQCQAQGREIQYDVSW